MSPTSGESVHQKALEDWLAREPWKRGAQQVIGAAEALAWHYNETKRPWQRRRSPMFFIRPAQAVCHRLQQDGHFGGRA